jgi:hypothetical protein
VGEDAEGSTDGGGGGGWWWSRDVRN